MAVFQHKYDKVCAPSVVINFANDALSDSMGSPVACVLMNTAEVAIFHHEVSSAPAFPKGKVAIATDPQSFWADRDGKLWLMTYPQLSEILAASPGDFKEDISLLLHMGCGQYTFDIVKACHDLWEWACAWDDGLGKPTLWVYTISNFNESIYRDAPATPLSTEGLQGPRLELLQPEAFDAAVARLQQEDAAHKELVMKHMQESQQEGGSLDEPSISMPIHTNRAVVFTSRGKLFEAFDQNGSPPLIFVHLRGNMVEESLSEWVEVLLQSCDVKTLLVEPDVGTIGTVRNLSTVLVFPVKESLFFDSRVAHVVMRKDMPMSQAEVRYACRVACSPIDSGDRHVVSIFTTKEEFYKLSPTPTDPLAFTGDFPALLLFLCGHSYMGGGDKTSPIRLPKDEEMIDESLRRLNLRGLTESLGGPPTNLGQLTSWWYSSGIRNFDVANLLAIAATTQGARASALMQIAAVLYQHGSPLMSSITSFLRFHVPEGRSAEFYSLLSQRAQGFARNYVERGPIWIAVGIWALHRDIISEEDLSNAKDVGMCRNMLQVSRKTNGIIEINWAEMSRAWTNGLGRTQVDEDPIISKEDFLFLEESIVRVWMHNLVLVSMSDPGLGAFACDLASGSPVARPPGDPVDWVRLTEEVDSEPAEGEPYTGVFAVYTSLTRSTGPDGGIQYVPEDLTFVSTTAVRRVLRDVATSKGREGYRLPSWQDLLRTRYPICHDPSDP